MASLESCQKNISWNHGTTQWSTLYAEEIDKPRPVSQFFFKVRTTSSSWPLANVAASSPNEPIEPVHRNTDRCWRRDPCLLWIPRLAAVTWIVCKAYRNRCYVALTCTLTRKPLETRQRRGYRLIYLASYASPACY